MRAQSADFAFAYGAEGQDDPGCIVESFLGDHGAGAIHPGGFLVDQGDLCPVAGEQDGGGPAIADAVGSGACACYNGHLVRQALIRHSAAPPAFRTFCRSIAVAHRVRPCGIRAGGGFSAIRHPSRSNPE